MPMRSGPGTSDYTWAGSRMAEDGKQRREAFRTSCPQVRLVSGPAW